VSRSPGPS